MFTSNWDEHFTEGTVMCWPFEIVAWPEDMPPPRPEFAVITFDGTTCSVYEYAERGLSGNRMFPLPDFVITRLPDGQDVQPGMIDFMHISRYEEAITVIPTYRSHPPRDENVYAWRDGMAISPLRLNEDITITEWNTDSLYFLRRRRW